MKNNRRFGFTTAFEALLRGRDARLQATHGYLGHAIGRRRRDGVFTSELCLTVFVRKKLTKRQLIRTVSPPAPNRLWTQRGEALATDVVELTLGRRDSTAFPGASIGASVKPNGGTLGCFARNGNGDLVGLTAGHVAYRAGDYELPSASGDVVGTRDLSMRSPVDAASIRITSNYTQTLATGGVLSGWRVLSDDDVGTTLLQLYGVGSQAWNAGPLLYLAARIGGWNLEGAIIADLASSPGDSGGPVIDTDGKLVGLHVGRGTYDGRDVAISSSMARVAAELAVNPEF